eukprot:gene28849-31330_t
MSRHDPAFVLGLGDNFYDVGLLAAESSAAVDAQFADRYERTFPAHPLRDVPWYVCAGNHDYYGGPAAIAAEIEYSKRSRRWVFPSLYFNRTYTDPSSGVSLVRDHLKEGRISKATHDQLMNTFGSQPPPPLGEAGAWQGSADDEQLRWLRTVLRESTADWKLVIGHFGVHSAATHEHGDTPSLIEHLQPLLERYGLAGVHYIGSGAGARRHHGVNRRYPGLHHAHSLRTAFHTEDGHRRYSHVLRRPLA